MARTLKVAIAGLGPVGQAVARAGAADPGPEAGGGGRPRPAARRQGPGDGARPAAQAPGQGRGQPGPLLQEGPGRRRLRLHLLAAQGRQAADRGARVPPDPRAHHLRGAGLAGARPGPPPSGSSTASRGAKKVSVLATGVNPGFAMDALALALTAPCARVRRVSVTRVVDAAARKLPLQRRVGAGLNLGAVPPRRDRGQRCGTWASSSRRT